MKPSAATTACAGRVTRLLAVHGDLDLGERGVAAQRGHLRPGDDLDRAGADLVDGALVGAERVAAVHERDRSCDRLEVERPVERAVTAADDDHVLVDVRLERRDEELHAPAQPAVTGGQRREG